MTIQLSDEAERALEAKAEAAGLTREEYAQRLLVRELGLQDETAPVSSTPLRTVSEEILGRIRALPEEAFEGLPTDGASQHDHYIYGTPKRDDL